MDLGMTRRTVCLPTRTSELNVAVADVFRAEGAVIGGDAGADAADIVVQSVPVWAGQFGSAGGWSGAWLNVTACYEAFRAALPRLRMQRWGRLILLVPAADPLRSGSLAMQKMFAHDNAEFGITANTVLYAADALFQEVAAAAAFLASDNASFLTGASIQVGGPHVHDGAAKGSSETWTIRGR